VAGRGGVPRRPPIANCGALGIVGHPDVPLPPRVRQDRKCDRTDSFTARRSYPRWAPLTSAYALRGAFLGRRRPLCARLGAAMGMLAFSVAFERWMKANDAEPFPPFADAALSDLRARAAELAS
jgi:hypothetical protein